MFPRNKSLALRRCAPSGLVIYCGNIPNGRDITKINVDGDTEHKWSGRLQWGGASSPQEKLPEGSDNFFVAQHIHIMYIHASSGTQRQGVL